METLQIKSVRENMLKNEESIASRLKELAEVRADIRGVSKRLETEKEDRVKII